MLNQSNIGLATSLSVVGVCATSLPLSLDQLPDVSSFSITIYIAWFVGIIYFVDMLVNSMNLFIKTWLIIIFSEHCFGLLEQVFFQVLFISLIPRLPVFLLIL